ncbi:5-bromo-4-chloroindolyl phosphate hydrolysis family protein [Pseudoflavonifractor phocaeensis]|uniref:5-bromo-4-chloroindolyl phosphate hydrolysis family protein n=1 Tax=Pseudoflavonifractor phocaeensis TaxID=1870988 RepID=UPI002108F7DD|nr:5-bromo-4-chloroindolyl phosphate hydrolysis family protein [Pseudoflavonifractor phocaeensis]MCQ4866142.1 5-bromo-4-chloroindolyl phosphate hydrolysis family protein [Pseudoflavonifractor phocaeensis]
MAKMVKKSVAPFYLVAALWLGWALLLPLYRPLHYVLAGVASAIVFVLGKAIWPNKAYQTPDPQPGAPRPEAKAEEPGAPKPEKKTTGDSELDKLVEQKDLALSEMRRLNQAIEDEKISAQIDHLEDTTAKIIQHVVENPQKRSQISRFLNYYLPTTLKLLNAYDRMDAAGVSGTNIDGTMGKIETMMDTVVAAFDKQLDALFGDVAMDISTDITVMENLLAQEGLSGGMRAGGL